MGMEVEHTSNPIQTAVTPPSSASTSGPKTSMFPKKPGFVIPKNKLSGSLVPLIRAAKKGDGDLLNEEATNRVQRKTKWGPDLTLDGIVRKGRASAYQARINQISQQLALGSLAMEDNEEPLSSSKFQGRKLSSHRLNQETLQQLEVEKREIIGELLKLNPSYKATADYKPLLKETSVPIPTKEYPGYNFIGLIFGPAGDTIKRLEKETGAKIRVYGTKADKGGKFEVTPTDGKEVDNSYENLYVHVSADTYEKIDAASALIELLVTPVSVNPLFSSMTPTTISDDTVATCPIQTMPSAFVVASLVDKGMARPFAGPSYTQVRGDIPQYPQAWFSTGPTHTPLLPQSGLAPVTTSTPLFGNPVQAISANMPSFFGPRPVVPASFSPITQNSSFVPSRPQPNHALQPPHIPMAPLLVHSQGNNAMASPNMTMSLAPQVNISNNTVSPIPAPSQSAGAAPVGHPLASLAYGSAPQPQRGFPPLLPSMASESVPSSMGPIQPALPPVAMHGSSPNVMTVPTPIPFPGTSPLFLQPGLNNSVSAAIPRPQAGSSGDFTFQPQRPQIAVSQVSLQSSQPANLNLAPPIQTGNTPLTPQPPFIRPLMHIMDPYQAQSFPRLQVSHQLNQPRSLISTNVVGSPSSPLGPPRHPPLPGHNAVSSGTIQHMQPRNFNPSHLIGNPAGPFPPRAATQMNTIQQNHSLGATPQRFPSGRPHFGNYPVKPLSGGAQQIYDPFSPTSVPINPQMGGNATKLHSEIDPEYEDLMASVGVK